MLYHIHIYHVSIIVFDFCFPYQKLSKSLGYKGYCVMSNTLFSIPSFKLKRYKFNNMVDNLEEIVGENISP